MQNPRHIWSNLHTCSNFVDVRARFIDVDFHPSSSTSLWQCCRQRRCVDRQLSLLTVAAASPPIPAPITMTLREISAVIFSTEFILCCWTACSKRALVKDDIQKREVEQKLTHMLSEDFFLHRKYFTIWWKSRVEKYHSDQHSLSRSVSISRISAQSTWLSSEMIIKSNKGALIALSSMSHRYHEWWRTKLILLSPLKCSPTRWIFHRLLRSVFDTGVTDLGWSSVNYQREREKENTVSQPRNLAVFDVHCMISCVCLLSIFLSQREARDITR